MRSPGRFITFEGIEGSGKTTHVKILADRLREAGREVLVTREPGGTALGDAVRQIVQADDSGDPISAESELLLFAASRAQLVRSVILPALGRGEIVLSDRFLDSTTAYQGTARGLDGDMVAAVNLLACGDAVPDVTILLDLDVPSGLARLHERNRERGAHDDRIEKEAGDFHQRVRDGYLELADKNPARIKVVDASADVDAVSDRIWETVKDVIAGQAG
jgi:dTMP kinase